MKRLFGGGQDTVEETFPVQHTERGMARENWPRGSSTCCESMAPSGPAPARSNQEKRRRHVSSSCAGCGHDPVFPPPRSSRGGTGWPSFYAPLDGAVGTTEDRSFFMSRVEVHCVQCGGHLGPCVFRMGRARRGSVTA